MKRAVLILLVSLSAVEAQAKVYPQCPDAATQAEGGGWFDQDSMEHCLRLDDSYRLLSQRFDILENDMDLKVDDIAQRMMLENELDNKITMLEHLVDTTEQETDQLQQSLDAWYHNPVIVGSLGFLAGVATSGIIYVVVHH